MEHICSITLVLSSIQAKGMSAAPIECYLTQHMACFQQLGHLELLRDRMLNHCSETATGHQRNEWRWLLRGALQPRRPVNSARWTQSWFDVVHHTSQAAYLFFGCSAELCSLGQDALLEARGAQRSGDGLRDGSRLYIGACRLDNVLPLI